jgi:hypothetical protein
MTDTTALHIPSSADLRRLYEQTNQSLNDAKHAVEAVRDEIETNGPPVDAKEEEDLASIVREQCETIAMLQERQLQLWNAYQQQVSAETSAGSMPPKPKLERQTHTQLPDLLGKPETTAAATTTVTGDVESSELPAAPPAIERTDSTVQLRAGVTYSRAARAALSDQEGSSAALKTTKATKKKTYKRKRPYQESLSREKFGDPDTSRLPVFGIRD